jgi:2-polyprenyl-6-methoxyphenol hydroxylase-like FAD-dependent oxidoreductase
MSLPNPNHDHALVIGGSMAGLAAARVLSDHFERVTVVERDRLADQPAPRSGVPQARQIHVLLLKGQYVLEGLFPGLQQDLAAAGAPAMDWTQDCRWFAMNRWAPRLTSGLITHFASRDLLEFTIRRRLADNSRVSFLAGYEAIGLTNNENRSHVTGIRLRARSTNPQEMVQELPADLVVDASGRESKLPQWLESLGYARPEETVINSFLGYASRIYEKPAGQRDWQALLMRGTPPASSRGGGVFPIEGNRWIANLGAARKDYPPTDESGFLEFARSLPDPLLYDVLKDAKPLSPVYGYRRTENRLRHYERLARWPENLVALGDAVCAFNPVYGQGMSVGAISAIALGECVRELRGRDLNHLARKYQRQLAKLNSVPWAMATSVDFLYPGTVGPRPSRAGRLTNGYLARVSELSLQDPMVHLEFLLVLHLVEPPGRLFFPDIAARVIRHALDHSASSDGRRAQKANEFLRRHVRENQ